MLASELPSLPTVRLATGAQAAAFPAGVPTVHRHIDANIGGWGKAAPPTLAQAAAPAPAAGAGPHLCGPTNTAKTPSLAVLT